MNSAIRWLDWPALLAYCGLIFLLSAQAKLPIPQVFNVQDKLLHLGAYSIMAIFSWRAFRHFRLNETAVAWISFLFCGLYGLSDEWHQSFVPGRTVSFWDWTADTSGAALTSYLIVKYQLMHLD
ncbi:MAG: VanZ family protein [Gammaproteobacteria bacterium]